MVGHVEELWDDSRGWIACGRTMVGLYPYNCGRHVGDMWEDNGEAVGGPCWNCGRIVVKL